MSVRQDGKNFIFTCDDCGKTREVMDLTLRGAWLYIRDEDGWRIHHGNTKHACKGCVVKPRARTGRPA